MNTLTPTAKPQSAEPYCSNCGYVLTGLTDSSKCPECGRPIVEVLTRAPRFLESGKRYRSSATLFGLPVVDIALGPKNGELRGKARGIVAIGDIAIGWLAIGGLARGIVAIGGLTLGVFSIGGASFGLLSAMGGFALSLGVATGGGAAGSLATGGGAVGLVAQGGGAVGTYARGGSAVGRHVINMSGVSDAEAREMFDRLALFFGPFPPNAVSSLQPMIIAASLSLAPAIGIGALAVVLYTRTPFHHRWL